MNRSIDFGYKHIVYGLDVRFSSKRFIHFTVNLVVSEKDSIILGNLQWEKVRGLYIQMQDFLHKEDALKSYLEKHKTLYGLNLSKKEMKQQLTHYLEFSLGCGKTSSYIPSEGKQIQEMIQKKDYQKISKWLRQISPEIQAYAIYGILELKKSGIEIQTEENRIIVHIKQRNSNIQYCAGCIGGLVELSTILKELER